MASVRNVEDFRALMCKREKAVVSVCTAASMPELIFNLLATQVDVLRGRDG